MQINKSSKSNIMNFNFEGNEVRTVTDEYGEPWFIATDVANILDYRMASDITRNLDDDEKAMHSVRTHGGVQSVVIINELGLYSSILKSRKQEAKRFKKWVTSEVLPSM